ncbi:hypothetical protein GGR58DRAFT_467426 [Xylaria digitata]|nr:hypothetical protein GGR58DRAFT_467426 [Xylaria digitata]
MRRDGILFRLFHRSSHFLCPRLTRGCTTLHYLALRITPNGNPPTQRRYDDTCLLSHPSLHVLVFLNGSVFVCLSVDFWIRHKIRMGKGSKSLAATAYGLIGCTRALFFFCFWLSGFARTG